MDELLEALDKLYDSNSETYEYKFEADLYTRTFFKETEEVNEVANLCDEYLIDQGYCPSDRLEKLKSYGYYVFPIESDSWGWLIAGLKKYGDPRVLIFG